MVGKILDLAPGSVVRIGGLRLEVTEVLDVPRLCFSDAEPSPLRYELWRVEGDEEDPAPLHAKGPERFATALAAFRAAKAAGPGTYRICLPEYQVAVFVVPTVQTV